MGNMCSGKNAEQQSFVPGALRIETQEGEPNPGNLLTINCFQICLEIIQSQYVCKKRNQIVQDMALKIQVLFLMNILIQILLLYFNMFILCYIKDQLKLGGQILESHLDNNNNELTSYSNAIGDIITQIETEESKSGLAKFNEDELREWKNKIEEKDQIILDLESEIRELRRKWNQFLVEIEDTESLKEDLQKLFYRIGQETDNYKKLLEQIKQMIESMLKIIDFIISNEQVKYDYDHKKETLLKYQEKTKQNQVDYESLIERFQNALEKLEELQQSLQEAINGKTKITPEQLQLIDNEAQKFLDVNRNLGGEIITLQKHLSDRRERLKDIDINENLANKRIKYEDLKHKVENVQETLGAIHQSLQLQQIYTVEDEMIKELQELQKQVEEILTFIQGKQQTMNNIDLELKTNEKQINDMGDQINYKDLKQLIPLIQTNAQIGSLIEKIKDDVEQAEHEIEEIRISIGELNIEDKLDQNSQKINKVKEYINNCQEDIKLMSGLIKELDQCASDDEEQQHINLIQSSFNKLSQKQQVIKDQFKQPEQQLEKIQKSYNEMNKQHQPTQEQLAKILNDIAYVEKDLPKLQKDQENLVDLVQKKILVFKEFDLKNKLKKRQKQCEDGKMLKTKVKNRVTKMIRKALEKSDQRLNQENKDLIEQITQKAQQYKQQYEQLSQTQDSIENELNKQWLPQIPNETLSISIQEQIRLLKGLNQVKAKFSKNNEDMQKLRDNLKQMQEQIYDIQEEPHDESHDLYQPVEGDEMDQLMADYIKKSKQTQININRIGPGQYMFGTKKISAKILNGKLLVRVGGGYTSLEEYIQTYGQKELQKQKQQEFEELNSVHSFYQSPSQKAQYQRHQTIVNPSLSLNNQYQIDLSLDDKVDFLRASTIAPSKATQIQKTKTSVGSSPSKTQRSAGNWSQRNQLIGEESKEPKL